MISKTYLRKIISSLLSDIEDRSGRKRLNASICLDTADKIMELIEIKNPHCVGFRCSCGLNWEFICDKEVM